jgi:hypothetical protein
VKVRIFHSGLTNRIFASSRYTERTDGLFVSSKKDDVTQEAIAAVLQHMDDCTQQDCLCQQLKPHPLVVEDEARSGSSGGMSKFAMFTAADWARYHEERRRATASAGDGLDAVLNEVLAERKRQDLAWGGPSHDDDHENNTWVALIARHLGRAVTFTKLDPQFRRKMITVAALAVAAVEFFDRAVEREQPPRATP